MVCGAFNPLKGLPTLAEVYITKALLEFTTQKAKSELKIKISSYYVCNFVFTNSKKKKKLRGKPGYIYAQRFIRTEGKQDDLHRPAMVIIGKEIAHQFRMTKFHYQVMTHFFPFRCGSRTEGRNGENKRGKIKNLRRRLKI